MKGKTIIQLFDPKTKQLVKEVVEENLVTNAFKTIVETALSNAHKYPVLSYNFWGSLTLNPSELFGGLLLLSEQQTESANQLIPADGSVVGHADNAAYTGAVSSRGSKNTAESGDLASGYKWVWDFATDRGNGDINCIALIQDFFGAQAGYHTYSWTRGSSGDHDYLLKTNGDTQQHNSDRVDTGDGEFIGTLNGEAVHRQNVSGTIYISVFDGSNLSDMGYTTDARPYETEVARTSIVLDAGDYRSYIIVNDTIYALVYDDSAATWYLKTYDTDFTTELSSVTLAGTSPTTEEMANWGVMNGTVYQIATDGQGMHSWNASTGAYIEEISFGTDVDTSTDGYGLANITDEMLCLSYERDDGAYDVCHMMFYNGDGWFGPMGISGSDDQVTVYRVRGYGNEGSLIAIYYGSGNHALGITPVLLNTINNLATTIAKDNTKTMKITYELTW